MLVGSRADLSAARDIAFICSGMILISEVADTPDIIGISKPAGLKFPHGEVKTVNPLFVGINVISKNNVAYLMKPDFQLFHTEQP